MNSNTVAPTVQKTPPWFGEYLDAFLSANAHAFILYGDINGYAYESVSHMGYLLAQLGAKRPIILSYDRAQGITFPQPAMKRAALELMKQQDGEDSSQAQPNVDPLTAALGSLTGDSVDQDDPFAVKKPLAALRVIDELLRKTDAKEKVAVVINYAGAIVPPAPYIQMSEETITFLVMLQTMATDRQLARAGNPIFLTTRNITDVHEDIRNSTSGFKAIEIALPDFDARRAYVTWYLNMREERSKPITLVDLDQEELARATAGLSLRHIEDILLMATRAGGVTRLLVKARKDDIITQEFSEVAEMIDPLPGGFSDLGGMDRLITWCEEEIITPIREGRSADVPKGVLLAGPPGTGKTYLVRGLARSIGFNAVALNLENILDSLVGQSEKKLRRFFQFARALAPVLIFVDEIDQSDISKRGNNSGNPVASNLFSAMLRFMSDETLRGKVIVFFASNRPDLIDSALKRFGRIDAIIPVLLPDEEARFSIVIKQAQTQETAITEEAARAIAQTAIKYSAGDLAAVVNKAKKLAKKRGTTEISLEDAVRAMKALTPETPRIADWYTLKAIQACNDTDLLPPEAASLAEDPQTLKEKLREAEPPESVAAQGPREERSW